VSVDGFITSEIREGGRRVGFRVETIGAVERSRSAVLARVGLPSPTKVGKYGVDIAAFERVALPVLEGIEPDSVLVVDEIGKMELASDRFAERIERLFATEVRIVAAVHAFRHPMTDALKRRADTTVIKITAANRDDLPERLAGALGPAR
jgi:nucleoside-triphosphatase